jgi:hypothetical protein
MPLRRAGSDASRISRDGPPAECGLIRNAAARHNSAFITMEGTSSRRIRAPCLTEIVESSPPSIVTFLRDQDISIAQVNQRDHLRTRTRRLPCRGSHFHLLLRLAHGRQVNQKFIGTDRNSTQVRRISTFEESSAIYGIDPALIAALLTVEPACNPSSMPWSRKTERQSWPIHRHGRHASGTSRWPVRPPKGANEVSYKDHRDCRESKRKFSTSCHMTGPHMGGWPTLSCSRVFPGLTITRRDDTTSPVPLRVHQRRKVPHPCRRQGWGLLGFARCRMDRSNPCKIANDCSRSR